MVYNKNIFISHSSQNKDIAEQLCAFITRFGVDEKRIFCSSIIGQGVGNGEKLNDAIGKAINKSKLLIYLLSYEFLNSTYCMEELGVGWYLAQKKKASCFYLVLPDVDLSELKGFVNSRIDKFSFIDDQHKDDLGLFAIDLAKKLKLKTPEHQIVINASKTFFSATQTLLNNIKEVRDNKKKEDENRKNEIVILKNELEKKDENIKKLNEDFQKKYEKFKGQEKRIEFETICSCFRYLGFCEGITKEEFNTFSKGFWFGMVNKYVELENEVENMPSDSDMEMLLATIYSANGNFAEAYKRLKKYVYFTYTCIYPFFYKNVIIEETNDMQEIIDILKEKLEKEPQGVAYDSYKETIRHLENRKIKLIVNSSRG